MNNVELGSRRVYSAGSTTNPDGSWVTQQARLLVWDREDREPRLRCLIHDRNIKFTDAVDAVFQSVGMKIILTPPWASNTQTTTTARPHQGIDLQTPILQSEHISDGPIQCRNVLGGIIHDYYRKAA